MNTFLYFRTYWGKDSISGWTGKNIIATNKMEMVKTCLKSLQLSEQNIHTTACVDFSTDEYTNFLTEKFDEVFHTSQGFDVDDHEGKWPVFGGRGGLIEVLNFIESKKHDDGDIVLILEDDYLFETDGLAKWIDACKYFNGFVSPFDHPDRYIRIDDSAFRKTEIYLCNETHWRNAESTTSVVGGKYRYFRKTHFLRKTPRVWIWFFWPSRLFGLDIPSIDRVFYRRCYLWLRIKLFTPIPGLVVHLSKFVPAENKIYKVNTTLPDTQLSPGVDWKKRYNDLLKKQN